MSYVTRYPNEPDESFDQFDVTVDQIEDVEIDKPINDIHLEPSPELQMPPLVMGGGTFSKIYGDDVFTNRSSEYLRMTRLALRYGITAFDTAPHYHPSEIILGKCFHALRNEFPRESYSIITKCGKYSPMKKDHILDEDLVVACVERSLRRFKTDYLDVIYIHDSEFNSYITPPAGDPRRALPASSKYDENYAIACGLEAEKQGHIRGEGDEKILKAIQVLRRMKGEGKIKKIGIASYTLPDLLRLSIMILKQTGEPLDIIQTYSHANLQNFTLPEFLPYYNDVAKVPVVMNASPLNMGQLTTGGGPDWHPAPEGMKQCARQLAEDIPKWAEQEGLKDIKIEDLAVSFAMREFEVVGRKNVVSAPVVVGCLSLDQIHTAVKSLLAVRQPKDLERDEKLKKLEKRARDAFQSANWADWSWESPTKESL